MRILADESVDMAVVRALRVAGHDVTAIAEIDPAIADEVVLARSIDEGRLLLSEDKDFGRFAAAERDLYRVVLLRFEARARALIVQATVDLIANHGERLAGNFVVLEPGRVRFHRP